MNIESFRIANYKSFEDSGNLGLEPGFNVIVGQNNVGKTALTEALSLSFTGHPHRSRSTIPSPTHSPPPASRTEISVSIDADELRSLLKGSEMPTPIRVPAGPTGSAFGDPLDNFMTLISEGLTIEATYLSSTPGQYAQLTRARLSNYGFADPHNHLVFDVDRDSGSLQHAPYDYGSNRGSENGEFTTALMHILANRVYSFKAVRFGIEDSQIGPEPTLSADARNLVQVLHLLYDRNPTRWQRYLERVRTVLPQVRAITFTPSPQISGGVRALLWNVDPSTERDDLAVPLSESGTGVGQVLAILYVAFASQVPRTIIIDEPQSFLHPGAVRKLFEILKGYPQHQYVITTHSPTAVASADPRAPFLVRKPEEESVIERIDASNAENQRNFLREVGASLSDVFGADYILWVEGATEEACYPLILENIVRNRTAAPLLGVKVIGVLNTGDFDAKKNVGRVFRIYEYLSEAPGLLPPAIGYFFDREDRTQQEREDLEREGKGKVSFTSRRMYENYLLNPHALTWLLSEELGEGEGDRISPDEVDEWLEQHGREGKYFDNDPIDPSSAREDWSRDVHGAKVLKDLFAHLDPTLQYRKTKHGPQLTRWLCNNAPEDLEELARLIEERLPPKATT